MQMKTHGTHGEDGTPATKKVITRQRFDDPLMIFSFSMKMIRITIKPSLTVVI